MLFLAWSSFSSFWPTAYSWALSLVVPHPVWLRSSKWYVMTEALDNQKVHRLIHLKTGGATAFVSTCCAGYLFTALMLQESTFPSSFQSWIWALSLKARVKWRWTESQKPTWLEQISICDGWTYRYRVFVFGFNRGRKSVWTENVLFLVVSQDVWLRFGLIHRNLWFGLIYFWERFWKCTYYHDYFAIDDAAASLPIGPTAPWSGFWLAGLSRLSTSGIEIAYGTSFACQAHFRKGVFHCRQTAAYQLLNVILDIRCPQKHPE